MNEFYGLPRVEPSSDHRQFAANLWQMVVALRETGFTDEESIDLVKTLIAQGGRSS